MSRVLLLFSAIAACGAKPASHQVPDSPGAEPAVVSASVSNERDEPAVEVGAAIAPSERVDCPHSIPVDKTSCIKPTDYAACIYAPRTDSDCSALYATCRDGVWDLGCYSEPRAGQPPDKK